MRRNVTAERNWRKAMRARRLIMDLYSKLAKMHFEGMAGVRCHLLDAHSNAVELCDGLQAKIWPDDDTNHQGL